MRIFGPNFEERSVVQNWKILLKFKFFGVLGLTALVSGCTLSSFFGDGKDPSIIKQKQYRKVNRACGGMDLSSSEISVQTFRSLLSCLNTGGALDRTESLFELLEDEEVEPLTRFINHAILNDEKRLFEIEKTYQSLAKQKWQDEAFGLLADVLERRELVSSFLHVLRSGYFVATPGASGTAQADEKILIAFQTVSRNFDIQKMREALDLAMLTIRSGAFKSLREHLLAPRSSQESEQDRDSKNLELVTHLLSYLKEEHTFGPADRKEKIVRELGGLARSNLVFPVLDQILGRNEQENLDKLPGVNRLMRGLVGTYSDQILFDQLAHSFRDLGVDQAGPLACMKGAKAIPDATRYLIREMAEFRTAEEAERYLSYEAPLTLMTLGPFCSFPAGLNRSYAAMHGLVDSGVTQSMVGLLQALYQTQVAPDSGGEKNALAAQESVYPGEPSRPWIDLVVHFFSDGGETGQGGVHHLTPVLVDAVSRGILPDALLLSTIYGDSERASLNSALTFLTQARQELESQSILEVVNHAAARTDRDQLYRLLKSLADLLSARDGQFLQNLLETARKIHFVNNATPFFDLIKKVGDEANEPENKKLFETFFSLVKNHEEAFLAGLGEWSELARNGELKAIVESMIELFHRFALKGRTDIHEITEPRFAKVSRHSLSQVPSLDLPPPAASIGLTRYSQCRNLDLEFSLSDAAHPQFSEKLGQFLACKGSSGDRLDLQLSSLLNRLSSPFNSRGRGDDDSFLTYQLGALNQTLGGFQKPAIEYLVNQWMQGFQFTGAPVANPQAEAVLINQNLWVRALKAVPFWTDPIKSLATALGPVVADTGTLPDLENLQQFGAEVLEKEEFPKLLSDAELLWDRAQKIHQQQQAPEFQEHESVREKAALDRIYTPELREVLEHWVSAVECWRPGLNVKKRVDEIIHESQTRVTTYDLKDSDAGPKAHLRWDFDVLKNQAKPLLNRVRDEAQSDPDHLLLNSTFKFFQAATGAESADEGVFKPFKRGDHWVRYTPEKLLSLFHKRALRVRPRIQYYKGFPNPYVVLDSDLDLMEKTLYNVDMELDAPPGKNLSFQFTEEIAHAWGDLPPQQWPDRIAQKYQVAFHLAQSHGFSAPSSWDEVSRKTYHENRPRTLKEAVDGILSRPLRPGVQFEPTKIVMDIAAYKAGMSIPSGANKNFSQDHGLEDLRILTEHAAGLASLPKCVQNHEESFFSKEHELEMVRFVHLPSGLDRSQYRQPPLPKKSAGSWAIQSGLKLLKGQVEFSNMQGMLFNLWQSVEVLGENVPGSPANDDGGLLPVMRDLFFEIYYSNPKGVLSKDFPSTDLQKNNMGLVGQVINLGLMHQMGLLLQKFELGDPELNSAFLALMRGATSSEMKTLTRDLLHQDHDDRLIWNMIHGVLGAQPAQLSELKRLSFYLLAGLNQIDPWEGSQREDLTSGVANRALARALEVITMPKFYDWFASIGARGASPTGGRDVSHLIQKLIDSRWASSFAEAMHQLVSATSNEEGEDLSRPARWSRLLWDFLDEPKSEDEFSRLCGAVHLAKTTWEDTAASNSWDELFQRVQRVQDLPEYRDLKVMEAIRPLLNFLEEKDSTSAHAARELRRNLAQFLKYKQGKRSNGLNELLLFAWKESQKDSPMETNDFNQLLDVLSQSIQRGDVVDFLKLIRRSLPESRI